MDQLVNISLARIVTEFDPSDVTPGTVEHLRLQLVTDGIGQPVYIPILVARGRKGDKVFGCTAAVHGNEINGIPVIQRLFQEVDLDTLQGILVGILGEVDKLLRIDALQLP